MPGCALLTAPIAARGIIGRMATGSGAAGRKRRRARNGRLLMAAGNAGTGL